jgi:hypothetical protein
MVFRISILLHGMQPPMAADEGRRRNKNAARAGQGSRNRLLAKNSDWLARM